MKFEEVLPAFRAGGKIRRKVWPDNQFIFCADTTVYNDDDDYCSANLDQVLFDDWEIFDEPTINWRSIMDNNCLCFFWNDILKCGYKLSTLLVLGKVKNYPFTDTDGINWRHCRPVRRDEINFYEDTKNER